jgi:hypothetical protein
MNGFYGHFCNPHEVFTNVKGIIWNVKRRKRMSLVTCH